MYPQRKATSYLFVHCQLFFCYIYLMYKMLVCFNLIFIFIKGCWSRGWEVMHHPRVQREENYGNFFVFIL